MKEFALTEHWLVDHSSHGLTESQARHLAQLNKPLRPVVCQNCGWPASIGEYCLLCCDMYMAVAHQKGLVEAHVDYKLQRRRRELGLL
jgi:hypothetical protein